MSCISNNDFQSHERLYSFEIHAISLFSLSLVEYCTLQSWALFRTLIITCIYMKTNISYPSYLNISQNLHFYQQRRIKCCFLYLLIHELKLSFSVKESIGEIKDLFNLNLIFVKENQLPLGK